MVWTRILFLILCLQQAVFSAETLFMSVLSSRRHRLGQSVNPVVGLFVSHDLGAHWQHTGWRESVRIFYTEQGPDSVIWCAAGNGILRSKDQGRSWKITTDWRVTEAMKIRVQPDNGDVVYAATAYGVFKTSDGGEHWRKICDGYTADLCIDLYNPLALYSATENGVLVSADSGHTWQTGGLAGQGIRVVAQQDDSLHTVWAGTEESGVFVSKDRGRTWQQRNQGLHHLTVYSIVFHPKNKWIYLGTHEGGVYRSIDDGATWQSSNTGMGNAVVHSLVALRSRPDTMLAGTINAGLYQSMDAGKTWTFNSQAESHVWGLSIR
jgi:photosystem II stability/assembly factor-like uncharacterized protein